MKTNDLAVSD